MFNPVWVLLNLRTNKYNRAELKTLEWDILTPDKLINLVINDERKTSII